jgi:hypothetical protein
VTDLIPKLIAASENEKDAVALGALQLLQAEITKAQSSSPTAEAESSPRQPLDPGYELALASSLSQGFKADKSSSGQKRLKALVEELGAPLELVAGFSISEAEKNSKTVTMSLEQVLVKTADVARAAIEGKQDSQSDFAQLDNCGFVERLLNIHLLTLRYPGIRTVDALCHHTDTSLPLLTALKQLVASLKRPPKGFDQPLEENLEKVRAVYLIEAMKAFKAAKKSS